MAKATAERLGDALVEYLEGVDHLAELMPNLF